MSHESSTKWECPPLLFDLLTRDEEAEDAATAHLRFDIGLLAERLLSATRWMMDQPQARQLGMGYFGASTGGAAALVTAASLGAVIGAVVSRGGGDPTWRATNWSASSRPRC